MSDADTRQYLVGRYCESRDLGLFRSCSYWWKRLCEHDERVVEKRRKELDSAKPVHFGTARASRTYWMFDSNGEAYYRTVYETSETKEQSMKGIVVHIEPIDKETICNLRYFENVCNYAKNGESKEFGRVPVGGGIFLLFVCDVERYTHYQSVQETRYKISNA